MTNREAHRKAIRLFTKECTHDPFFVQAHVSRRGHSYDIGYLVDPAGIVMFHIKGSGDSWEAAFADHEHRHLKDNQQMDEIRKRQATKQPSA